MRVLLDMDGVLVNFVQGVCDRFDCENPYEYGKIRRKWDICSELGLSPTDVWPSLDFSFWINLKPYPWFRLVMNKLESKFGAKNICLLTTPVSQPGCRDGKYTWIKQHLPEYSTRHLIGVGKEFCAGPGSLLIDDKESNIRAFRNRGGFAFLFAAPWNLKYKIEHPEIELIKYLNDWEPK